MGLVRADLAARVLHPLLHLGQELIDQLRPRRGLLQLPTSLTRRNVPRDRVMGTARQLGGIPIRPREVERFQYFHDLPCRLDGVPPRERGHFSTASALGEGPKPPEVARQRSRVGQIP